MCPMAKTGVRNRTKQKTVRKAPVADRGLAGWPIQAFLLACVEQFGIPGLHLGRRAFFSFHRRREAVKSFISLVCDRLSGIGRRTFFLAAAGPTRKSGAGISTNVQLIFLGAPAGWYDAEKIVELNRYPSQ